jgi:hypothetical protein
MKAKTWRNDRSPEVRQHRGSGPGQTQSPPFPRGNAGPVVLLAPQGSVEALLLRRVVPGGGGTGLRGALSVPARVPGIHPQPQPEQGLLAVPAAKGLTIDRGQGGGRRSHALTCPPKGRNKNDQARSHPAAARRTAPGMQPEEPSMGTAQSARPSSSRQRRGASRRMSRLIDPSLQLVIQINAQSTQQMHAMAGVQRDHGSPDSRQRRIFTAACSLDITRGEPTVRPRRKPTGPERDRVEEI